MFPLLVMLNVFVSAPRPTMIEPKSVPSAVEVVLPLGNRRAVRAQQMELRHPIREGVGFHRLAKLTEYTRTSPTPADEVAPAVTTTCVADRLDQRTR